MIWAGVPFAGTAIKNAGQLGIAIPIISPTAAGSMANVAAAAGSPALANWIIVGVIDSANPLPRQVSAFAAFREKYQADPDVFIAIGWDGMQVLFAALQKATEITRAGVHKALMEVKNVEGSAGVYSYSATERDGTDASSLIWLKVVNGKLTRSANP
jgi:branched-chain amino acid transport system substrate-binding protein